MYYLELHGINVQLLNGKKHYRLEIPCKKLAANGLCSINDVKPNCCRRGKCIKKERLS